MTIVKKNDPCNPCCRRDKEALYQISRILSHAGSEEEFLSAVLEILESNLGMSRVTLLLLSADGDKLVYAGSRTRPTAIGEEATYRRGEGIVGKVLQGGCPVILPRISESPEFHNRIHQRPPEEARDSSFICVPVMINRETIGALSADLPFDDDRDLGEDERLLGIVASLISYEVNTRREAAIREQKLQEENRRLREQIEDAKRPEQMIGCSDRMRAVYRKIAQVAPTETAVLIRGESGTGKELAAAAIVAGSDRSSAPFIKVNCAALSETLLESELFGHEKGAFTGAFARRKGRIEEAEGGTLFLDEIGDFSPAIQVKLLRVIQEKEYSRVGSNEVRKADIRFIFATNRDLEKAVAEESFRQDLYYRINVFPIMLPPLRERREDILPLANFFIEKYGKRMNKTIKRIGTTAIDMLMAYHWPGNVRELENCVEHAVLLCNDDAIQGSHLPPTLALPEKSGHAPTGTLTERVNQFERDMLTDALKHSKGNISLAARELGITARIARYKIDKLEVNYKDLFNS